MLRRDESAERGRKYKQPNRASGNAASRLPAKRKVGTYVRAPFSIQSYGGTSATGMQIEVCVLTTMAQKVLFIHVELALSSIVTIDHCSHMNAFGLNTTGRDCETVFRHRRGDRFGRSPSIRTCIAAKNCC